MAWNIEIIGTRAEIQTALNALVVSDQLENQQFTLVRKAILQSIGLSATIGVPIYVSNAMYEGKIHLTATGHVTPISSRSEFSIQAVYTDTNGQIIGGPSGAPAGITEVLVIA